jgi:hypothetical protein
MAFVIRCGKDAALARKVITTLNRFIAKSRFIVSGSGYSNPGGITTAFRPRLGYEVRILGIRLRVPKGYCGNHAGPCRVTGRRHKTLNYLEGLDWVSWNEMLNDALDSIRFDGDVASSHCIIRKGRRRRLDYLGVDAGEFDRDTDAYGDYCGRKAPPCDYHWGTPGIIGWGVECVEAPYDEPAAVAAA